MSYNCLNCWGDGYIEVHSPEGDYIKSCPECGGTGKRQITIQLQKYDMLKAELARYKQEAEKIPDICYRYRYDPDECVHNDECPKICPKRNGGGQDGSTTASETP